MTRENTIIKLLRKKFPQNIKGVSTSLDELSITLDRDSLIPILSFLKEEPPLRFNLLSDLCAVDYLTRKPRFEVVYLLRSLKDDSYMRIRVPVDESSSSLPSITHIFPNADWYEREVFDMFGIKFDGHPNLRRILMPDGWKGHPLRKDYPLGGEEVAFSFNKDEVEEPWKGWWEDDEWEGHKELNAEDIKPETLRRMGFKPYEKGKYILNLGPQHPSSHGLLRFVLELEGEMITRLEPVIGYLHTGIEKTGENLTYQQALTLTDRMDYLNPLINNLAYCLTVEKMLGLKIPKRVQYIRVLLCELQRIASHLVFLASMGFDLGAASVFLYCFREREAILDIFEMASGARMMTSYINIGGLRWDIPDGWLDKVRDFVSIFPEKIEEYEALLTDNPIFLKRTKGVGILSKEDAIAYGVTGPILRASGIKKDLRKDRPYSSYEEFEFEVPAGTDGDVFDRYMVRVEEMRQSLRIIDQALKRIKPKGVFRAKHTKIVPPDKRLLDKSMEAVIHHFLIHSSGFPVPEGEAYVPVESARGELGFYMIGDGGNKPYRFRERAPSFANVQAMPRMSEGCYFADLISIIPSVDPVLGEIDR